MINQPIPIGTGLPDLLVKIDKKKKITPKKVGVKTKKK